MRGAWFNAIHARREEPPDCSRISRSTVVPYISNWEAVGSDRLRSDQKSITPLFVNLAEFQRVQRSKKLPEIPNTHRGRCGWGSACAAWPRRISSISAQPDTGCQRRITGVKFLPDSRVCLRTQCGWGSAFPRMDAYRL
jgi:hypothetical protein